jgi:hypothetical protein
VKFSLLLLPWFLCDSWIPSQREKAKGTREQKAHEKIFKENEKIPNLAIA